MSAMEYKKDCIGEKHYASRNYGSLRHTYTGPGANRTVVDWTLQLRQVRKKKTLESSASAPNLTEGGPRRDPAAAEHPDGPYQSDTETVGRYQNMGNTRHMLQGPRAGTSGTIDWQLNLRGGLHRAEFATTRWKRHYGRMQQSFDMMKENCGLENQEYQSSNITPQDRRPDRRSGAICIASIRENPMNTHRHPGCEGSQVGQWRHLIDDRSRGYKTRGAIEQETTLRDNPADGNGARISENRSDGCLVEMMGKKRWSAATSHEPLAASFHSRGDAKLYHLSNLRPLPEQDEDNRELRMSRHPRRDLARGTDPPPSTFSSPKAKQPEGGS